MVRRKKELSVYIHVPFCARKCAYCDFVSAPATRAEMEYYMGEVVREIRNFRKLGNFYQVKTIFFGGGTPSLVDPELIRKILEQLRNQFILAWDAEITLECNPGTLTEDKLTAYRDMGVNRLSIGLQSTRNEELRLLGRIHTWEDFQANYRLARRLGFDNINIDLISALPGQSEADWLESLIRVAELEPEHISAYSLIIEEGTPFYERYGTKEGRALLPDEDTEREIYHTTRVFLESQRYHRYEISNYARKGFECRHNITYWNGGAYVGFGMAAASYLENRRFTNPSDYTGYWNHVDTAWNTFVNTPELSLREQVEECMFLGLRMMEGVSATDFRRRFGLELEAVYGEVIGKLEQQGLLETVRAPGESSCDSSPGEDADALLSLEEEGTLLRVRLTQRGIDLSNVVLSRFLLEELPEIDEDSVN